MMKIVDFFIPYSTIKRESFSTIDPMEFIWVFL
jgi:hypothetical protein